MIDFPCLNVKLVPRDSVVANDYNPNHVPSDKLRLLVQSIKDNGFCFPIVTIWDETKQKYVIVDGFHRFLVCGTGWLNIDSVPVVVLPHDITRRWQATYQFNNARGVHALDGDAELVRRLAENGESDAEICKHLGLDAEAVHRYKTLTGIAGLFRDSPWSESWKMEE